MDDLEVVDCRNAVVDFNSKLMKFAIASMLGPLIPEGRSSLYNDTPLMGSNIIITRGFGRQFIV